MINSHILWCTADGQTILLGTHRSTVPAPATVRPLTELSRCPVGAFPEEKTACTRSKQRIISCRAVPVPVHVTAALCGRFFELAPMGNRGKPDTTDTIVGARYLPGRWAGGTGRVEMYEFRIDPKFTFTLILRPRSKNVSLGLSDTLLAQQSAISIQQAHCVTALQWNHTATRKRLTTP